MTRSRTGIQSSKVGSALAVQHRITIFSVMLRERSESQYPGRRMEFTRVQLVWSCMFIMATSGLKPERS